MVQTSIHNPGPTAGTRGRWRRRLTLVALILGVTTALVGLAPAANAKPGPVSTDSCSGNCGPCPTNMTWHSIFGGIYIGYLYEIRSANAQFFLSDARQVYNGLATPIEVTVTSSTSKTHTVTTTVGYSADLLKVLHTSVSVSIVNTTTTAIGVSVKATVPPFSTMLAEYGMFGWDVVYDATRYLTTSSDLRNNVCGKGETTYNQRTVGPTLVEGWRITSI